MRSKNLKKCLYLLIALATIQHTAIGQQNRLDTSLFSIKQSIRCFEEQKVLGEIIFAKDTIISEQKQKIANLKFLSDTCLSVNKILVKENKNLEDKVNKTKSWNKALTYTLVIETIVLLTLFFGK